MLWQNNDWQGGFELQIHEVLLKREDGPLRIGTRVGS